jgi:uncharacterized protein YbjT (DUF2867 family)
LATAGHDVIALHRTDSDVGVLRGVDVALREGDIKAPRSLTSVLEGAEVVFHRSALFREARYPDSEYWR